ncbi:LOW QUALITY PROTEIN: hypothetical protein TorRG33x02_159420 [Trema orientale]|uniref:Uncharacterized protein n=1 Tax=Trema orientale TaxID=63057 RepID=A0A2P5ESA2_TREOI|nr:LOW QUALITY PROTEIN: hypothetical protein TorRG33x02_159420 [Trema orientale]
MKTARKIKNMIWVLVRGYKINITHKNRDLGSFLKSKKEKNKVDKYIRTEKKDVVFREAFLLTCTCRYLFRAGASACKESIGPEKLQLEQLKPKKSFCKHKSSKKKKKMKMKKKKKKEKGYG